MSCPRSWLSAVGFFKSVSPSTCTQVTDHSCPIDWHLLPCAVTFRGIIENLPGKLNWNALVLQPLVGSHWVCTSFINHHVSPGTPDWSEGKLLCMQCVLKLMGRRVLNSLRELRTQRTSSRSSFQMCLTAIGPSIQMGRSLKIAGTATTAELRGHTAMR